ncbi:nucleoside hydrolase [Thermocoleostomius sinensis]|uniref:Nucleoside hydrolase n=1 Tax=Thermocoleostomius sinensis A174 TaxID=2016057 RepID=A0A9E9C878_9CYAN|nr:nucleoside hydrolase [Thermocoleostomius sinensis]WAL58127.1 nucleoside hydrolase [Thermocoleostomius sinensis A174]
MTTQSLDLQPLKIILDTDPGGDDSFAFLWLQSLAKQGLADIVAVTAADGNVHAQHTFVGASKLLQLGGFPDVEVGRGVIGGSNGEVEDAGAIHGADGMGNLSHTLPNSRQTYETARYSDDLLIEKLKQAPGDITLVAIGPLTNLAAAERKSPGVLQLAKEIVIMGGAFEAPGNVTPEAEFNIAFDADAADIVFNHCDRLVVIPLDVTHQLIFTNEMAKRVSAVNSDHPIAQFVVSLCQFMVSTALAFRETRGQAGFLVHDAATLAYLFHPETLLFRRGRVQVETKGKWTRGKTVLDRRHSAKVQPNAWIAMEVDSVNLLAILIEDLKYLIRSTNP